LLNARVRQDVQITDGERTWDACALHPKEDTVRYFRILRARLVSVRGSALRARAPTTNRRREGAHRDFLDFELEISAWEDRAFG
jgi:hypothetical protein